jgi:pantothenate kinase type III
MKKKLLPLLICSAFSSGSYLSAQIAMVLKYGTITSFQAVKKDSKHAGGVLAGGTAALRGLR